MPVGKLNWFGCFALLFYVFFYLSVDETDGEAQSLFKKQDKQVVRPPSSLLSATFNITN